MKNSSNNPVSLSSALLVALTLAACSGGGGGGNGGQGRGPVLSGLARYLDNDLDGQIGSGDSIVVPFDQPITADTASIGDFRMLVDQDSFGTGAGVQAGPAANEVTIVLGNGAVLRSRGGFAKNATAPNSPSGIDVSANPSITDADGRKAEALEGTDVAPVFRNATRVTAPVAVGVTSGDINRDGKVDVIAVSASTIFLNYGDGSLTMSPAGTLADSQIRGVVAGDLNRFTADELVTFHNGYTQVWNNQVLTSGQHKLTTGQKLQTGETTAVALADVTGNGKLDILAANTAGLGVYFHLGNLGNTYKLDTFHNLAGASSVVAQDFDGDGDIDIALGRGGVSRFLENDGSGSFTDVRALGVTGVFRMAAGDVDGDGDEDLVAARGTATTILLRNDGRGQFSASTIAVPARHVQVVDIDGDSFADVVTADTQVRVWMSDRTGGFLDSGFRRGLVDITDLHIADIDRDTDADLVVANTLGADILGGGLAGTQGASTFEETDKLGLASSHAVALGDVDGDGDLDKVVANNGNNEVWLNDGKGKFTFSNDAGHILGAQDSRAVVLGDLDQDGDLDVVIGNTGATGAANELFENDGNGKFTLETTFGANTKTLSLALAFVNADQKLDIVVGNDGANQVFRNQSSNGQLVFLELNNAFPGLAPAKRNLETIALIARDIDTDGDQDLIVLNNGTEIAPQTTQVFRHAGETFTLYREINAARIAWSMSMGDFDNDGTMDLAIARSVDNGAKTIDIYRGLRTLIATLPAARVDTNTKVEPRGLALVDLNGDGNCDLFLANRNAPSEIWLGDGKGGFTKSQNLQNAAVTAMAVGDIDADGDLDAVMTVDGNGANRVYTNK
jgi:FG-GAP-like repeat